MSYTRPALELAGELGGLPLALEQATAYMQATGTGLARYLPLFRARQADLLGGLVPTGDAVAALRRYSLAAPAGDGLAQAITRAPAHRGAGRPTQSSDVYLALICSFIMTIACDERHEYVAFEQYIGCIRLPDRGAPMSIAPHRGGTIATLVTALTVLGLCLLGLALPTAATAANNASVLYVSPVGTSSSCVSDAPCSLVSAQALARKQVAQGRDVTVEVGDGIYRMTHTWTFGPQDSGTSGNPVRWQAAPGAHPVISGAQRVTGWKQGSDGVWSAHVPAGSETRQLYVDGVEAPVAQATPAALGFSSWPRSSTGSATYDLGHDQAAQAWFAALTPTQVRGVEFDYPNGNGAWTDSSCRVASYAAGEVTMTQPCWSDVTDRTPFSAGSGGLPSMDPSTMPSIIRDAPSLLHRGQWYLDPDTHVLSYKPLAGQTMVATDVELPRLARLVQVAGTLAHPVHDVTFSGLQFSYATWNDPSGDAGFAEVQSNLRIAGATNQGMCQFSDPVGSCPWGALTQPLANVSLTAAEHVSFTGDRFVDLGGAGLGLAYGSSWNLVRGNEFTGIASTALLLGCTADPTPVNPDPTHFPDYLSTNPDTPQTIKDGCTPDPAAVAGDQIGANEIMTGNQVTDNLIHNVGTDYTGASAITLLFTRSTTIEHNDIFDVPYTGITGGVIQGHVDLAAHPDNSLNINADNSISDNLIHDYMQVRNDGGALYIEGHQASYQYAADGTLDHAATLSHGLLASGNVTYAKVGFSPAFYDDAGSEWIHWDQNVAFDINGNDTQGGCSATGHFLVTGNYGSGTFSDYFCTGAVDTTADGNVTIPEQPGPGVIPDQRLAEAGIRPAFVPQGAVPEVSYESAPTGTPAQVLIGGEYFTPSTPVFFGGKPATSIHVLSGGFLVAGVPAGADASDVTVGPFVPKPTVTSPAPGSVGATSTPTIQGNGVAGDTVRLTYSEGTACSATVAANGSWSCTPGSPLPTGLVSLTATQQNPAGVPSHSSTDLFYVGAPPATLRVDDTDPGFTYEGGFSYSSNRGLGDYNDDIHYATTNGASVTYTFIGTSVKVYGEQYVDQGDIGVSIDGGAQTTVDTVPADGQRHSDVAVFTSPTLAPGLHTVTVTKLSGQYFTFDGVEVDYAG